MRRRLGLASWPTTRSLLLDRSNDICDRRDNLGITGSFVDERRGGRRCSRQRCSARRDLTRRFAYVPAGFLDALSDSPETTWPAATTISSTSWSVREFVKGCLAPSWPLSTLLWMRRQSERTSKRAHVADVWLGQEEASDSASHRGRHEGRARLNSSGSQRRKLSWPNFDAGNTSARDLLLATSPESSKPRPRPTNGSASAVVPSWSE